MFFQETRLRWQQRTLAKREAIRQRREDKTRLRRARIEEIKRRVKRTCQCLVAGLAIALGCGLASFVYGAYSAGREANQAHNTAIELAARETPIPVAPVSFPSPPVLAPEKFGIGILPDPVLTPGEIDPVVDLEVIGGRTANLRRHVSKATSECAWSAYRVPPSERERYRLDHLIPIELGGASDICRNLWPQSIEEAARKDRLETALNRLVRHGQISLHQAQSIIAKNWIAAYARFVLQPTVDVAAGMSVYSTHYLVRKPAVAHALQASAMNTFTCGDGSASRSGHRRGACSHHGGIR